MTWSRKDRHFFLPATGMVQSSDWQPSVDPYEAPYGWLVKLDLAGVDPADVRVRCASRHLVIQGVRRDLEIAEGCRQVRMEIAHSRFRRRIELPCDAQETRVDTTFQDGMVLIRLIT